MNLSGTHSGARNPIVSPKSSFIQDTAGSLRRSIIANVYQTLRMKKLSLESPPHSSGYISAHSGSVVGSPRPIKGRHSEISPIEISRKIKDIRLRSLSEARERVKSQKRDS